MLHWDLFSWKLRKSMLQGRFSWCFTLPFWKAFKPNPRLQKSNRTISIKLAWNTHSFQELNLLLFKVELGKTAWVLDHSFCSFTEMEWRHSSGWSMGLKFGLVAFSAINLVFVVHVDSRLFGTGLSHGMGCWQDRIRPNTGNSFSEPWKSWCHMWFFFFGGQGQGREQKSY